MHNAHNVQSRTTWGPPLHRLFGTRTRCVSLSFVLSAVLMLSCLSAFQAHPLGAQVIFDHLSYRDGLVNSSISSILQDKDGFLWFGSQGGLHRYDGYDMMLFGSQPFDPASLSHQLVQTLYYGPDGTIWIGTYGGINKLDTETFSITKRLRHEYDNPHSLNNDIVVSIAHDAAGQLWVGTLDGLHRLDSGAGAGDADAGDAGAADADATAAAHDAATAAAHSFTRFLPNPEIPGALPHQTVRALHLDSRGRLWAGSLGGLSLVQEDTNGEIEFLTIPGALPYAAPEPEVQSQSEDSLGGGVWPGLSLPHSYVMDLAEAENGDLWIGMWGGGVARLSADLDSIEAFELPDNRVYQVLPASDGLVYVATWGGGLVVLEPESGGITRYLHNQDDPFSISHDVVYSLYEDRTGIIWIGTNGNGISRLDRSRIDYRFIHPDLPEQQRLSTGRAQTLFYDTPSGELYIGVQEAGLHRRDPETGAIRIYTHNPDDPNSISNDNVSMLLRDHPDYLIVATNAGLDRFYPDEERFESVWGVFADLRPLPPIVYSILRAHDGSLWVGTYDAGLFRLLPDGEIRTYAHDPKDQHSLSNNLIYHILQDAHGEIWVATNGGLNRFRPESEDFTRYLYDPADQTGVTSNSIAQLYEDSRAALWVGTRGGGLLRYNPDSGNFSAYTYNDGLTSNFITAFHEGEPGVLYVATPSGMNRFDTVRENITQIDERDGLTEREFTMGATKTQGDELLFGAFSAVVRIPIGRSYAEGHAPQVHITGIKVMNSPLQHELPPHRIRSLTLPHTKNFISFEFAAMDFALPHRNHYRYRLVGLDSTWIEAGNRRFADYTGLAPGNYVFEVLGADAHGTWSETPARIELSITPPFWRTDVFGVALVGLIAAAIWTVFQLRTRSLRLQNARLEELVQERTDELHQLNATLRAGNATKDRFFSIVSHDLRGPIGGMRSFLTGFESEIETLPAKEIKDVFRVLKETVGGIESMLENLLSWSRLQSGSMPIDPVAIRVDEMVDHVFESYLVAAQAKNIRLERSLGESVYALADPHALKTVLNNIVNNAVKFTPRGGTVGVEIEQLPDTACITVRDTGVGIPADKLESIFAVDQVVRTRGTAGEKGSGLGLTLCKDLVEQMHGTMELNSTKDAGTIVVLQLPKSH
ncbi:MAG: hypothetical protein EA428_02480 [Spirochaetaceae bacterium]|nr:MAG: hypothetical protein EA428_02480 [Spirochaetaceae bacterium]